MRKRTGYLFKRGKVYYATWKVAGKRFMQTTKKRDRREAEAELARIMEPFYAGDEITTLRNIAGKIEGRTAELTRLEDERNPPLTLSQAWNAYLSGPGRPDSGERTLSDYQGYFDAFAEWMKRENPVATALRDVTPKIAGEYTAHLTSERGLSGNSFNKHVRLLELLFRVVKEPAHLTVNPWEGVQRKRAIIQHSRRELTIEELKAVCAAATGEMRLLFAIGIYTGLRLGDAATLRWGEVDVVRGEIRRIPSKVARRNPTPIKIPIHPALKKLIDEIPQKERGQYILPKTASLYTDNRPELSRRIQNLFEKNGILTTKTGTGKNKTKDEKGEITVVDTGKRAVVEVGFHSLRHTFVSLCREANAPLSVVESIVGHSNPAMTRHYTHTSELAAASAVNSLPAVMGGTDLPALPAADPLVVLNAKILALADKLNAKNWRLIQDELRALVKPA